MATGERGCGMGCGNIFQKQRYIVEENFALILSFRLSGLGGGGGEVHAYVYALGFL